MKKGLFLSIIILAMFLVGCNNSKSINNQDSSTCTTTNGEVVGKIEPVDLNDISVELNDKYHYYKVELKDDYKYQIFTKYIFDGKEWLAQDFIYNDKSGTNFYFGIGLEDSLVNENDEYNIAVLFFNDKFELQFGIKHYVDDNSLKMKHFKEGYVSGSIDIYKECENIIGGRMGSLDDKLYIEEYNYINELINQSIYYDSSCIITFKATDEMPKEISPDILVENIEG